MCFQLFTAANGSEFWLSDFVSRDQSPAQFAIRIIGAAWYPEVHADFVFGRVHHSTNSVRVPAPGHAEEFIRREYIPRVFSWSITDCGIFKKGFVV